MMTPASMAFVLLDPLAMSVERLLRGPSVQNPLATAAMTFGERADVASLTERVLASDVAGKLVVIDFSLIQALGEPSRLQPLLDAHSRVPLVAAARESLLKRSRGALTGRIPLLVLGDDLRILDFQPHKLTRRAAETIADLVAAHNAEWPLLRRFLLESRFAELASRALQEPPEGREYIKLPDGSAANKWVGVKQLLTEPALAVEVAYNFALELTSGLTKPPELTAIVTASNTGFLIACYLQLLMPSLRLFMIDRLGPFPQVGSIRFRDLDEMRGHTLCVVEDVISTGRELDLISLFAYFKGAQVGRVITLFDLEVARPLLVPSERIVALCRLARFIDYRRIGAYDLVGDV